MGQRDFTRTGQYCQDLGGPALEFDPNLKTCLQFSRPSDPDGCDILITDGENLMKSVLAALLLLLVHVAVGEPSTAGLILEGARAEARLRTPYIMEYRTMKYPGGDVPPDTGVCTDLVVRAFRHAGYDLQSLLHEDRVAHPEAYPTRIWNNKQPDKNIDHRRCQNLAVWFRQFTQSLTTETHGKVGKEWQAGDVVFFVRSGKEHPWHVAIISDKHDDDGMPLVIDSFPPNTSETHRLDAFGPIHSHFRLKPELKKNYEAGQSKVTGEAKSSVPSR